MLSNAANINDLGIPAANRLEREVKAMAVVTVLVKAKPKLRYLFKNVIAP